MKLLNVLLCIGTLGNLWASEIGISELHELLSQYYEDPLYYDIPCSRKPSWANMFTQKIDRPIIPFDDLSSITESVIGLYEQELENSDKWLNAIVSPASYIQKIVAPAGSSIAIFSDIHGSAHSLARSLQYLVRHDYLDNNFFIKVPQFYIVLLGDFIDRGVFSPEVLYMIMQLKVKNPTNVFILAGNHELNPTIRPTNWRESFIDRYGLTKEEQIVMRLWDMFFAQLPKALYWGTSTSTDKIDYLLFSHAAFDPRKNIVPFLVSPPIISYSTEIALPRFSPKIPCSSQYEFESYTDDFFTLNDESETSQLGHCVFGKKLVNDWFNGMSNEKVTIHGIIRGHQHSEQVLADLLEAGNGYTAIIDNKVHTIFSGPGASNIFLPFDSFLLITTAPTIEHWTSRHIYRQIGPLMKEIFAFGKRHEETPEKDITNFPLISLPSIEIDRTIEWKEKPINQLFLAPTQQPA